jgi:putative aldouronate transport system permease protein
MHSSALLDQSSRKAKGRRVWKRYGPYRFLLLMLVPGLAYYLLFKYGPMYGLIIAFKEYRLMDGILGSQWAGLKYFKQVFTLAPDFWHVFSNTLIISIYKLIFCFPAPIVLALLFNEVRNLPFKKTVQTISYMPYFISWVVLGGILMNFFSPFNGPVGALFKALGQKPVYILGEVRYFRTLLVVSSIWKGVGWGTIIYLAALAGVDVQLYEAAVLDGAGKFKQMLHITLPSIASVIVIMLIFAVGGIVSDDFDQILNLYNPTVYRVGDVFSTYVYRAGLQNFRYSFATAAGLFRNVISFALIVGTNYISGKFSEYVLW